MENEIFLSIKPKFVNLIYMKEKNYEFRNYKPKNLISKIWIYTSSPVCELQFMIDVEEPVEFPNKILVGGVGNLEFNQGLKKAKFAFPIKKLFKLEKPIPLKALKQNYNFTPPQSFVYCKSYETLRLKLNEIKLVKVY
jgi:predicted transcriptional regulator